MVEGGLPPTAYRLGWRWANDSQVEERAWRSVGCRVEVASLDHQRVHFALGEAGGARAARRAAARDAGA